MESSPMEHVRTVIDLTGSEQLCFNCRALLDDGPKHRIHGYLLCNKCTDIVSLLRSHDGRVCLVCALASKADDVDCEDIQNFLDRPNTFVKQYDWRRCLICDDSDNLLYTPCGHVFCCPCWGRWEDENCGQRLACPMCRNAITLALVTAQSRFLVREYVEGGSRNGGR